MFTIDSDNNITYHPAGVSADVTDPQFNSPAQMEKLAAKWPASRLVEIWNSIPGTTGVKKFQDRKIAARRIWAALQDMAKRVDAEEAAAAAKAKSTKQPKAERAAERDSKKAQAIAMMSRAGGATLDELMTKFGWQRHTVRGFISILATKHGVCVRSSKSESGSRTYEVVK